MGLTTEERDFLRVAFAKAFSPRLELGPDEQEPTVGVVDFMKFVKVIADKDLALPNSEAIVKYFVLRVRDLLIGRNSTLRELIVMVDGKPPKAKKLVAHKKRYGKEKGKVEKLISPGDRSKRYLPEMTRETWPRFASNYHLMRRELYPELFNAFASCRYFRPGPGQCLILSGFPGRTTVVEGAPHELKVKFWAPSELPITKAMERADPDLYHRTYLVRTFPNEDTSLEEWQITRNDIAEGDIRMFWFDHFYQNRHIIFYTGDGDIFSIGALYAFQRRTGIHVSQVPGTMPKYEFRNRHTACLPYLKKDKDDAEEYVNLDLFYALVREYPPMVEAGVQNPVLSLVFLIILCGSDFCNKFLHKMGSQNIIWNVFLQNAAVFSHMVMMGEGVPGATRTKRTLVLDEDAFKLFVRYCYLAKYEPHRKKLKVERLSYAQLDERTRFRADMKTPEPDVRFHLPDSNTTRKYARAVLWNLEYWVNGPLGHGPDPFEIWQGVPYYPYRRDAKGKAHVSDAVSHKPKPVDRVFEQHLYRMKLMQTKRTQ